MDKFNKFYFSTRKLAKKLLPGYLWPLSINLRRFRNKNIEKIKKRNSENLSITIVVPCYNHSKYLDSSFSSIINQTYRPLEVIFIEDNSEDNTLEHLNELCNCMPKDISHRIIRTPKNSGQCFAINMGVKQSTSPLIMILNDDDYLMHDAVETSLKIFQNDKEIFLLGSTCIPFSGMVVPFEKFSSSIRNIIKYEEIPLKHFIPSDVINFKGANDLNLTHSGSTFLKAAWESVGGYYSNKKKRVIRYSDRDFQYRIASLYPVAVAQSVPFVFWRNDSSVDGALFS